MPVTRSATRLSKSQDEDVLVPTAPKAADSKKRKAPTTRVTAKKAANSKKARSTEESQDADTTTAPIEVKRPVPIPTAGEAQSLVPAVLTFSYEDAKQHLISVDARFEDVFRRLPCKPFEHLERLDPFRTLANSILGQQISWRAARAIIHRFVRLFNPALPEKAEDYKENNYFPTAHQVADMDIVTLRSAGLSGRKAEYVLDLAARFADGRLSTEKLLAADDEELAEMLIEVRGIGRWTVDMFAIFSLRRPDILPIGDLGVQRGVMRWFLSLHSPSYKITLSPEKAPRDPDEEQGPIGSPKKKQTADSQEEPSRAVTPDISSAPPIAGLDLNTPAGGSQEDDQSEAPGFPPAFTPSINKTLNMQTGTHPPLPEGLTPSILRSRLDGKKKIKGALLTPKEMEELTEPWRPYRSLAVYYMWALAEETKKA